MTDLTRSSYAQLLKKIREALARGRERARQQVEKEKAVTYLEVGKFINEDLRIHDGRAGYGERLIPRLASDLNVSGRLLWQVVQVESVFPILQTRLQNLEWSHLVILASIENKRQRERFLKRTLRGALSVRDLVTELKKAKVILSQDGRERLKLAGPSSAPKPLKPRRGELYTYRIVKPRDLHERPGFYSIDLGFKARIDLEVKGLPGLREGAVIEAVRTLEDPRGDRYRFRRSEASPQALHTYKARVTELIDLDTYWAAVDVGFRVWVEEKLRLRGINAPEKGEAGQKEGMRFLKKIFSSVPFVVVKLSGRDKFDRFLTDLFYLPGEADPQKVIEKGNFLNQELVDRGFALLV